MVILNYRLGINFLIVGFVLSLISACTHNMENVISKKSFSAENITNEKVLFWGLSTGAPLWEKKEFSRLSNTALSTLASRRDNVDIRADTILLSSLGEEKYREIYQKNLVGERLSSETLSAISSAAEDYRYVVLSRIDKNQITELSNHSEKTITYTTKRELTIHTEIYDLQENQLVWSGDNSNVRSNTNTNEHHGSRNFFKDIIHDSLDRNIYGTYPSPPAIEYMVRRSFKQLADSLPNKSCSELGYFYCAKRDLDYTVQRN